MGCEVMIQSISGTLSSPCNSLSSYEQFSCPVWKELVKYRWSRLQRKCSGHFSCYLWYNVWKFTTVKEIMQSTIPESTPTVLTQESETQVSHLFTEATLSKAVCQKTFMGGEHIWCQSLFLLWIFLFNNDSTLTASLVVHMSFSLAPSHWAWGIPFHQTQLIVWNLLKDRKAVEVIKNWIFTCNNF